MSKKLALIDGYGFVFRAYHSLPPLTRSDGTPVGAVYGFTNMLIKLLASLDVSHLAVVFDSGSKTFRNDIFPAYKANRPPCPEDLKPQFSIVRQSVEALNLAILEKIGFEADDIIATFAKKYSALGFEVLIVSSDKDLMQLVDERVLMFDAMKNKMISATQVKEKFLVEPNQVLDVLSLMGDASDNVMGVKGIGPKTAAELILQFGSLENIFLNLDQIKQEKRRQLLKDGEENAKLAKILISLKEDVETKIEPDDLKIKSLNPHKLISFLEQQGFRSLITKVRNEFKLFDNSKNPEDFESFSTTPKSLEKNVEKNNFDNIKKTEISSLEIVDKLNSQAVLNGIVIIDFYQNFFTISTNKFGEIPQEIFYFQTAQKSAIEAKIEPSDLFDFPQKQKEDSLNQVFGIEILDKILLDSSIKKVFFDAKSFLKLAKTNSFEDVSLINHLLTSSTKNELSWLINLNLNSNLEELGFNKIFDEISRNHQNKISTEIFLDAQKKIEFLSFKNFAIAQLYQIFSPQIFKEKLVEAYEIYEKPSLVVLAKMEEIGVKIDIKKLRELSNEFGEKINQLSDEIYALAGKEFNIASPKQLGEILFEKLGFDSNKKSKKTGALSTGVGVLEMLEENGHEIARKILDFRKFSKLKNTYTDSLPKEINPKTGRIHTHFSTTSTITGRLSSSNPNLQNIPIKSPEGQKIRQSFIAAKDHFLISADYSQIELRVIAHVAKIENLIAAFKADKDIHKITAAQVFRTAQENVDESMRSKAKAINFGIIYGISAFGLAKQLGIGRNEAGDYIKSYLEAYPGIDVYMKNCIEIARGQGFVQTLSGRKCFISHINNKNPILRNEAERLAINAPIQGSAADIVKKAMINLNKKFTEEKLRSKIVLQIHDELVVETPEEEVEIASKILKTQMERAVVLSVPLKVDVKVGNFWS